MLILFSFSDVQAHSMKRKSLTSWILGHGHRNTEFKNLRHLGKQQALVRPDSELELAKKEAPGA